MNRAKLLYVLAIPGWSAGLVAVSARAGLLVGLLVFVAAPILLGIVIGLAQDSAEEFYMWRVGRGLRKARKSQND